MSVASNQIYSNNVNGTGTENSEGLVSDKGLVCEPADLGSQPNTVSPEQNHQNDTTTRKRRNRKWTKEQNILIMECYFCINSSRFGY